MKALALLDNEYKPLKKDDAREPLPNESPIDDAFVRFIFRFDKANSDKLFEIVAKQVLCNIENPKIVINGNEIFTLKEVCATNTHGLYEINILEEKKLPKYYPLNKKDKLFDSWKKPTNLCPQDFTINVRGKDHKLFQYKLININTIDNIPENYLENASMDDIESLIGSASVNIVKENLPNTIFWKYKETNLLPISLDFNNFAANPNICMPLKNMFILAGYTDIKNCIEEAQQGTDNQFQNFLNRIAKKTTAHFRSVWKEYNKIEFSLRFNADQLIPGIKEKNSYDFTKRSDGFKRFVAFLLMISVNLHTNNLHNTLLLIDEPDNGLHPSGARYLRDELIRIAQKNYVMYSTHSIFMIDPNNIGRHYIVKKQNEITTIETAIDSNIVEEEVIYNALGYSIFESLKEKNVIFEGWYDKKLFQIGLQMLEANVQKKFANIGICHAYGAKRMRATTPLMELAKRECLIISDVDKPAKDQQKIYQQENGYGEWKTYQEVDPNIEAITGEDYLDNAYFIAQLEIVLQSFNLPTFNHSELPEKKGKLTVIQRWLTRNDVPIENVKNIISALKNRLFENLTHKSVNEEYQKLLHGILKHYYL